MYQSRVVETGMFVPEPVVTNEDLAKKFDTNSEWIIQATGIHERHYVPEGMTGAEMTGYAAESALEEAGLEPDAVDAMICATLSPDYFYPSNPSFLQQELGLYGVPTYDVRNQCSGFIYSLSMADQFIRNGTYKTVLVCGSEIHSTGLEMADRSRNVSVIFGDGAGAFVVRREDRGEGNGILSSHLHGDGSNAKMLWTDCEGSLYHPRLTADMIEDGSVWPQMHGRKTFVKALQHFPEAINDALEANNVTKDDVKCFIFHQANLRITEMVLKQMEVPVEKSHNNIVKFGNTTAASIPIAYHEAKMEGKFQEGDLVLLVAFGAGFTWGSVLMRV